MTVKTHCCGAPDAYAIACEGCPQLRDGSRDMPSTIALGGVPGSPVRHEPLPPSLLGTLAEVFREVKDAEAKWPPMNSAHEAYGVLTEEYRELEQHVFTNQKRRDIAAMRAEAIQVAAMAVRFVRDVCDGGRGRV